MTKRGPELPYIVVLWYSKDIKGSPTYPHVQRAPLCPPVLSVYSYLNYQTKAAFLEFSKEEFKAVKSNNTPDFSRDLSTSLTHSAM